MLGFGQEVNDCQHQSSAQKLPSLVPELHVLHHQERPVRDRGVVEFVGRKRRTLRRSLATLLISNGENVKVAQSQLRHTTPKITLELYAQAVYADQQKAHRKVVQMVVPARFPEKLKARSAAPAT